MISVFVKKHTKECQHFFLFSFFTFPSWYNYSFVVVAGNQNYYYYYYYYSPSSFYHYYCWYLVANYYFDFVSIVSSKSAVLAVIS